MSDSCRPPASFAAGETVTFSVPSPTYTGPDWAMQIWAVGRKPGLTNFNDEGDWNAATQAFDFVLAEGTTTGIDAGDYDWTLLVEKNAIPGSEERHVITTGTVRVTPNPVSAAAGDMRSEAEIELQTILDWKAGKITADVERYQIDGTMVDKVPLRDVWAREKELRRKIALERDSRPLIPIPIALKRLS